MSNSPDDIGGSATGGGRGHLKMLLAGSCADPAGVLGPLDIPHETISGDPTAPRHGSCRVRVFLPPALAVEAGGNGDDAAWTRLEPVHPEGVFEGEVDGARAGYRLRVRWESGETSVVDDPYRFGPSLTPADFEAFAAGEELHLEELMGAREGERDGVPGTRFAVWAPRAIAVNLMGSFNGWEARRHPMFPIEGTGVWELFVPGVGAGAMYKFQIRALPGHGDPEHALALEKADPLGLRMELRPRSASVVGSRAPYPWTDEAWLARREERHGRGCPVSIYEVHLGSWRRRADGSWLDYRELAGTLLPYARDAGFTHIELLPVTEHPHDASWGYQTVGYFALTSRYGGPDDFRAFVDEAHRLGLGVILDWVPAHFPHDAHGLARFDGRPLYEHPDPRRGAHPDWGTAIFDFGRPEVISFLVSSARFWIDSYHIDGLRVDAVASMLYLDYSRGEGQWEPNVYGGKENLEALAFLRRLTSALRAACPGALLCAEESTAWSGVTRPVEEGGLGFHVKWNMGWMNDTLAFFRTDPLFRSHEHHRLTFSLHYAHHERHLLPMSHDEVVHLKRSLISKMPGSYADKFANLRLLFGYMWTHPGAKLLFMGGEIGEWAEWSEAGALTWELLDHDAHRLLRDWLAALNARYRSDPSLHGLDEDPAGFEWADVHDARRSVLAYYRWAPEWSDFVAVVANFANQTWTEYRAALPKPGAYDVVLDSDDPRYGGGGRTRIEGPTEDVPLHGRPVSLVLDLPPLTILLLKRSGPPEVAEPPPTAQPA